MHSIIHPRFSVPVKSYDGSIATGDWHASSSHEDLILQLKLSEMLTITEADSDGSWAIGVSVESQIKLELYVY